MLKPIAAVAIAAAMLPGCERRPQVGSSAVRDQQKPLSASIDSLLTNPRAFDGKIIAFEGAAVAQFENSRLCRTAAELGPKETPADRVDVSDGVTDCIWLNGSALPFEKRKPVDLRPIDKHYGRVIGRFNARSQGHAGCCRGSIDVWSIVPGKYHGIGDPPPVLPEPSANNSSKPTPLRGAA